MCEQCRNQTREGRNKRLTWDFAEVKEVVAAAVGGLAVLVTPAARCFIVEGLVAAIPARRVRNDRIWKEIILSNWVFCVFSSNSNIVRMTWGCVIMWQPAGDYRKNWKMKRTSQNVGGTIPNLNKLLQSCSRTAEFSLGAWILGGGRTYRRLWVGIFV